MGITTISVIGGFLISGLTILSNIWISYLGKKSDKKSEFNLKIIELAYKEYEFRTNITTELAKKDGVGVSLYPFDYYLIYYTKLSQILEKGKLTESEINKMLVEMKNVNSIYIKKN